MGLYPAIVVSNRHLTLNMALKMRFYNAVVMNNKNRLEQRIKNGASLIW